MAGSVRTHTSIRISVYRVFVLFSFLLLLLFRRHTEANVSSFSLFFSFLFHFFHFPTRSCLFYFCLFFSTSLHRCSFPRRSFIFFSSLSLFLFFFFSLSLFFWSGYVDSRGIWPLLFWGFSRTRTAQSLWYPVSYSKKDASFALRSTDGIFPSSSCLSSDINSSKLYQISIHRCLKSWVRLKGWEKLEKRRLSFERSKVSRLETDSIERKLSLSLWLTVLFFRSDKRTRRPVWILETWQLANWEISWGRRGGGEGKKAVRLSRSSGIRYDALRMNSFPFLLVSRSPLLLAPPSHGPLYRSAESERKYLTKSGEHRLWNQFTAGRKSIFELFRNSLKALETWNWQRPADTISKAGNDTFPLSTTTTNHHHHQRAVVQRSPPFDGIFTARTFIPPRCTDSLFFLRCSCAFSPGLQHNTEVNLIFGFPSFPADQCNFRSHLHLQPLCAISLPRVIFSPPAFSFATRPPSTVLDRKLIDMPHTIFTINFQIPWISLFDSFD